MGSDRSARKSKPIQPPKKRRLSEFRGMFRATKPYVGVEATRQYVAHELGEELERGMRKADEELRHGETVGLDALFARIEQKASSAAKPSAKASPRSRKPAPRSVKRRR